MCKKHRNYTEVVQIIWLGSFSRKNVNPDEKRVLVCAASSITYDVMTFKSVAFRLCISRDNWTHTFHVQVHVYAAKGPY